MDVSIWALRSTSEASREGERIFLIISTICPAYELVLYLTTSHSGSQTPNLRNYIVFSGGASHSWVPLVSPWLVVKNTYEKFALGWCVVGMLFYLRWLSDSMKESYRNKFPNITHISMSFATPLLVARCTKEGGNQEQQQCIKFLDLVTHSTIKELENSKNFCYVKLQRFNHSCTTF